MKKIISLTLALSILISVIPYVVFAEDNTYGLSGNPIIVNATTSAFYEMEDYPLGDTKLSIKSDADSSGGKYVYNSGMTSAITNRTVTLSIDTEEIHKIKIYARMKRTGADAGTARVVVAKNNETMIERPFYFRNGKEYMWVCLDSYELEKGYDFTFNIEFAQASVAVDKLFITGNIHEFPKNMGDITKEIDVSYLNDYYNEPVAPIATHPRLFVNDNTLPKVRANLTVPENKTAYDSLLANANPKEKDMPKTAEFSSNTRYMVSNAFLSVISEDETEKKKHADIAIERLVDALSIKSTLPTDRKTRSDHSERAYRIHVISLIYDWCYDYLTEDIFNKMKEKYSYLNDYKDIKEYLFAEALFYIAQYEMTYPPAVTHGSNNGHISEAEVFLGLLSTSLAFYDEYPDMYKVIGGKLFDESIWARNFYYEMGSHTQGSNYMSVRMANEFQLFALMEAGVGAKVMEPGADELLMEYIYGRRPDSLMFRNGDGNGPDSYRGNLTSVFFFANYLNNSYLRDEFTRQHPTPTLGYVTNGLSDYLWLIYNNPDVERKSYKELPLTRFTGKNSGVMYARTSWEMGKGDNSDAMAVRLNLDTMFGGGHDHLDAGHFDIYYKGALALDTGFYIGTDESHHRNYFKRTVAHNSMLLYDPDEVMTNRYSGSINDGGQKYLESTSFPTEEQYKEEKMIGEILAVDYGEDMHSPSFSYMKGDLTKAYATDGDKDKVHKSDKMKKYTRSFVFLNFFDDVYPGALIVFDKMTSNNPEFKKTWLLHTQEEPSISGGTTIASKSENGDNGRLINTTLLPKAEDREIIKIGGVGNEFNVNGTNYPSPDKLESKPAQNSNDYGVWRIELSPKTKKATDYFLNVLHVTENDNSIPLLQPELIEAGDFAGVKIKDRIAFFGLNDERYTGDISFEISDASAYEILVTDIKEGAWDIYKDGVLYETKYATEDGGNLSFKGGKGAYTLKKNTTDLTTFTRNLNYLDYTKPLSEEVKYLRFNNAYEDIPYIIKDDILYLESEMLSNIAACDYEYEDGNLKFTHSDHSLYIPVSSEDVISEDGKYYVNLYSLRELYYIVYTHPQEHIYEITMEKRAVTTVYTGSQFSGITLNEKGLYIIKGTETLNDGTKGIVLPSTYSPAGRYVKGAVVGVDGFNNIQLTSNQPLFDRTTANAYIGIKNINLKGPEKDGTGNIVISANNTDGTKASAALLNYSIGAFDLEIHNVNNYVNMVSDETESQGISYVGAFIGRRYGGTTIIKNCNNFGNVDATKTSKPDSFPGVGGIIGQLYVGGADYITKFIMKGSKNYGDVSTGTYYTGGLLGGAVGENSIVDIIKCGNYGNISTGTTDGTGGIIGAAAANVTIKETFNAGDISIIKNGAPAGRAAGIIGRTQLFTVNYGTGKNSTYSIENSFNAGKITAANAYGIMYYSTGNPIIRYCYNAGLLEGTTKYEISQKKVDDIHSNYHLNSEVASDAYSEYITKEVLATELPVGFSKNIWEYTFNEGENKYSLPQIVGNTCELADEKFYVEKIFVNVDSSDSVFTSDMADLDLDEPVNTETGEKIETAYVIATSRLKVSEKIMDKVEYGMLISKYVSDNRLDVNTASAKAVAKKNYNGAYGILFHGNMVAGDTYYVRPYVKYNGEYTYGDTVSFVFPKKPIKIYRFSEWLSDTKLSRFEDTITTCRLYE